MKKQIMKLNEKSIKKMASIKGGTFGIDKNKKDISTRMGGL